MAFTFETSGNNTFLVYAIQEEDILDTMTLGMITNNRIPGIASVLYTQMNRDRFLKYNVTARVTVRQFFSGIVNKRRLLGVFSSVAAALAAAEEYMIDSGCLLLDTDYIYADVSTCRAEVICLPVAREAGAVDMGLFFKNIMFSTQFDQTENCDYVARIINYLNSTPVFVVDDFVQLLEELQGMTGNGLPGGKKVQEGVEQSRQMTPQPVPRQEVLQPAAAPQVKNPTPQSAVVPQAKAVAQPQQSAPSSGKHGNPMAAGVGFAVPGQGGDGGFAVPGQSNAGGAAGAGQPDASRNRTATAQRQTAKEQSAPEQAAPGQTAAEKEISMFYLLQHYNKENAAAYKAQKEARKRGGKAVPAAGKAPAASNAPAPSSGFAVPGQQPAQPPFQQPVQPQPVQPAQQPVQPQFQQSAQPVQHFPTDDNFGDTVVMGVDGYGDDTVVIGEAIAASIQPYLRRISNNEKIFLSKPVFRIGKERSYVDYCISGNATVSRSHADIINRNGQFFVVDNNSTNHTYVNGEMITSNTEIPLSHGTKLRLSNEEFEFLTF